MTVRASLQVCLIVALSNSCFSICGGFAVPPARAELARSAPGPARPAYDQETGSSQPEAPPEHLPGSLQVFSVLGSLAHNSGQTVAEIASRSGTGLAFISIAEGCATSFGGAANVHS